MASVLTIIAVPFEPSGTLSIDLFNRPIAIAGIWVVVSLGIQRRKYERDIEKKACEIARSNAELEQFAYMVSRDLKEPLATTIGNLALLEKQYAGKVMDEKAQQFVRNTIEGEERMSRLTDDLLELSRLDSITKSFEKVNMNEVLSLVEQNLDHALKESTATIISDPLPTVMADQGQMMELLQNLIANAIKFRRPGEPPRIQVSATSTRSEWTFSLADNGIGIPEEQQELIFQMFHRLHTEQEYPGTGVGLAICKKIAEHHGGRIWVKSEEGKGATFYFTIPAQG
jgi:light-regulated signal transduction histidine kinase (bacteriophytochrome)